MKVIKAKKWFNRLKRTESFGPRTHEVTPFVFNDRLYFVENHPRFLDFNTPDPTYRFHEDEVRIRDAETKVVLSVVFTNHYFGEGFVEDGKLYVYAGDYGKDLPWRHHRKIDMVYTEDLVHWSKPVTVIEAEGDELLFNTAICRGPDRYILLYETNDKRWPSFTFKYCEGQDLANWKRIPGAVFPKDKYAGGPALYYADGWYYTLYVNALPGPKYDTRIARSKDLVNWQDAAPERPVLAVDESHIPDPEGHPNVHELSASDAELVYWKGKTVVYFHSGDQQGVAGLEKAEFEGTPEAFLKHYFD